VLVKRKNYKKRKIKGIEEKRGKKKSEVKGCVDLVMKTKKGSEGE